MCIYWANQRLQQILLAQGFRLLGDWTRYLQLFFWKSQLQGYIYHCHLRVIHLTHHERLVHGYLWTFLLHILIGHLQALYVMWVYMHVLYYGLRLGNFYMLFGYFKQVTTFYHITFNIRIFFKIIPSFAYFIVKLINS